MDRGFVIALPACSLASSVLTSETLLCAGLCYALTADLTYPKPSIASCSSSFPRGPCILAHRFLPWHAWSSLPLLHYHLNQERAHRLTHHPPGRIGPQFTHQRLCRNLLTGTSLRDCLPLSKHLLRISHRLLAGANHEESAAEAELLSRLLRRQ